jgi:hypothetical protein
MWRGTVAFYIDPSWNTIKQRMQDCVLQIIELCSAFVRVEQVGELCARVIACNCV